MITLLLDNYQDKRNDERKSHHFFYYGSASVVAELIGISKFNTSNYLLYDTRTMIIPRTDRYTVRLHVMATNGNGVYAFDIDGLSGKNPICRLIKYGDATGNMGAIELTYDDSNIYLNTAWTNNVSYLAYGTEIKITNTKTVGGTAITPF